MTTTTRPRAMLLLVFFAAELACAEIAAGDWVDLRATNREGIPFHARSESSLKGRLPDGTRAKVLALGEKNWVQIQTQTGQTGWIVRRYIKGGSAVLEDPGTGAWAGGSSPGALPGTLPGAVRTDSKGFAYGGLPKDVRHPCPDIAVLQNTGFLVGYCEQKKNPAWAVYRLFPVPNAVRLERPPFHADRRTAAKVDPADYTRSGYTRGHMAPNFAISTRYGAVAQDETFLMSNIVPQKDGINSEVWARIEHLLAETYANRLEEVWVIVGPVFDAVPQTLASGVEIPDAFFMIAVDELAGRPRALAWLVSHDANGRASMETFLTSVDRIEEATGLDFLAELPDPLEAAVEARAETKVWQP